MQRANLAIIGGGLVGASLALILQAGARERGWRIVLIEPFAPGDAYQPSYDARSSALSFGSRQIYERLGLWQRIAQRGEPISQIHVSDRGRFGSARLTAMEEGVPALGYVVENAWLGQCLWQALDHEVVSWRCPAEVRRMQALDDGYRLTLDDDSILDCDLAVLADGGRSGLRELPERQFLDELQAAFGYRLGGFRQVGARYCYPLTLSEAEEQVRPHLVVLGNAAHSLHPIAGQGFNLSLRDAQALADQLLGADAAPGDFAVLQRYLEGQRLDQQMTVGFSDRVTRLFSNAQPVLATGRNLGLLGLDLLPPAKRWFARQAMGLGARPV